MEKLNEFVTKTKVPVCLIWPEPHNHGTEQLLTPKNVPQERARTRVALVTGSTGKSVSPVSKRSTGFPWRGVMGTTMDVSTMATIRASPQAKEEEAAEMELICIKEEPAELETHTLESPQPPDHHSDHRPDQGRSRDDLTEATITLSSSTCWVGQGQAQWEASTLRAQQQQQRAELKRRSQVRRRERERSLPQPLQAALERERREKTRIRVARWRAKRKMQAGLLASHLDYQQQVQTMQASEAPQCHQQYGGLLYSGPHCENSALYPPLPVGLRQDLTDTLMQPGPTSAPQGILGADSELFQ
ncbi:hypothetical protein AAFF_G00044980 [Aldrovandia affinis]|uniref:Uncharacterized protein n=1 Tax=Aldrovandia affinis TaxID=143900 RepID=A0AAD7S247_9TELE|nr:hypothetical protein AAFF_G00044980 [Aldrovandia affinis]